MFFFLVVSLVNYDKRISEIPRQIFCVSLETFIALKPKLFSKATVALLIYVSKSSGICPSDVNLCRTVVKKTPDRRLCSSRRANRLGKICSFRFAHRTICSSETICPSRRFVRPLVWKWPLLFLPTQIRFPIGGKCVTFLESKLTNFQGWTKLTGSQGSTTWTFDLPMTRLCS